MSKKCHAYSKSKLGLAPVDNRKAFYAGWDAALAQEPFWYFNKSVNPELTITIEEWEELTHQCEEMVSDNFRLAVLAKLREIIASWRIRMIGDETD